jgi:hypothetical protein
MSNALLARQDKAASSATTTAVVVVGSMAGLVAARVLSDHVDRVVVVERDRVADRGREPPRVPQGRHAHALLGTGQQLIDRVPGAKPTIGRKPVPVHAAVGTSRVPTMWVACPVAVVDRYLMAVDFTPGLNPKLVSAVVITSPGRAGRDAGGL